MVLRFDVFGDDLLPMSTLPPRRAPEIIMTDIVFPDDANTRGTMFGGKGLALMDKAAFLAAVRFAHVPFVTVSTDGTRFLKPVQVGDIIETRAKVAFVGRTSLVVKVELYRELPFEMDSMVLATRDWFAMAARDQEGKPLALPPLLIETEQEKADEYLARQFRDRSKGMK
jgi:acyl-CoA hydrolase